MSEFAVSAIGRDRPGIVAGLSEALLELEGNIEDSQMSILRGHFAVMLIVEVPDSVGAGEVDRRLRRVADELGLEAVAVNPVEELVVPAARPSHVITVYGADRPGIVHAVSSALARREVNITGLETRLAGSADSPLYVMTLEVALGDVPKSRLDAELRDVADRTEVEVSIRPLDADAL